MTSEDETAGVGRPTVSLRRIATDAGGSGPVTPGTTPERSAGTTPSARSGPPDPGGGSRAGEGSGEPEKLVPPVVPSPRPHPAKAAAGASRTTSASPGPGTTQPDSTQPDTAASGSAGTADGGTLWTGPIGNGLAQGAESAPTADAPVASEEPEDTGALLHGRDLRRLGGLGLVLVIVGALVGFGASFLWPAQYVGRATVLYVITQEDPTGFLREDRNLITQQLLMQSNAVTAPVAAQFGLTAEDLVDKMTVTLPEGSELITVDVRDPSQDLATRMAAAVSTQYLQISVATQPMADQARFLQDQLNTVTVQVDGLLTANTPAALAQLPAASQRQSQLSQQLDQLNLAQVARPTARLVVPAYPVGQVTPRPWFGAATGAVVGLVVAVITVAVVARRWHRSRA